MLLTDLLNSSDREQFYSAILHALKDKGVSPLSRVSEPDQRAISALCQITDIEIGMDYREGRYEEREYYLKYKIDGVNSAGQPVTLFLTDI